MTNDDDHGSHGAPEGQASGPPGERERVIGEVWARIAAHARRTAPATSQAPDERPRDAPPPAAAPTSSSEGATQRSPPRWVAQPAGVASEHPPVVAIRGPAGAAPNPAQPTSLPPVVKAPTFLTSTAPLPELSTAARAIAGAASRHPAPAPQPPPQRRAAPRTVPSRVVLGGTAPIGDDSIEKAVAGLQSTASAAPLPPLNLRQFASLCAELAFQPQPWLRRGILARYGVHDEAAYTALEERWRRERAARLEVHSAFTDDFASHLAWLHTRRA